MAHKFSNNFITTRVVHYGEAVSGEHRRIRATISCLPCRRRKVKCNRQSPCHHCNRLGKAERCVYSVERDRNFELPHWRTATQILPSLNKSAGQDTLETTETLNVAALNPFCESSSITGEDSQRPVDSETWHTPGHFYSGISHWSFLLPEFTDLLQYVDQGGYNDLQGHHINYKETKGRMQSTQIPTLLASVQPSAIFSELPPREYINICVTNYFEIFECVYGIIHSHSFLGKLEQFMQAPEQMSPYFVFQLLLVILVGNSTVCTANGRLEYSAIAHLWSRVVSWRSAAFLLQEIDLEIVQLDTLMLLAKRIYHFETPQCMLISPYVIHRAMLLGLHREPTLFNRFSTHEAESRRRLWYAILELDLVCAIDTGMPPSLEPGSWDTLPPRAEVEENYEYAEDQSSRSAQLGIGSRGLALLTRSLPLRLRIVGAVNKLRFIMGFEEAIRLGTELVKERTSIEDFINSQQYATDQQSITDIVQELLQLTYDRVLFCLHKHFAARTKPEYEFSEYTCLRLSSRMLDVLLRPTRPTETNKHGTTSRKGVLGTLASSGGYFFESDALNAALLISFLLVRDSCAISSPSTQISCIDRLRNFIHVARERTCLPYPSGKAFIVPSMALEWDQR
ncbi:hypothetical protein N7485_011324 [Penicillium canescens]|nr:hypothetical protein N7485_011324 [Penicillium canescens]